MGCVLSAAAPMPNDVLSSRVQKPVLQHTVTDRLGYKKKFRHASYPSMCFFLCVVVWVHFRFNCSAVIGIRESAS